MPSLSLEVVNVSERPPLPRIAVTLIAAAAAVGCSNPREDVRLTLCKDMVAVELGTVPTWQGSEVQTRGYNGAVVTVRFAAAGGDKRADCFYKYDAKDDTALTLANPIEAYSTSPSKMILDGRSLAGTDLAQAVKRAMEKQGREFVDRAKAALQTPQ